MASYTEKHPLSLNNSKQRPCTVHNTFCRYANASERKKTGIWSVDRRCISLRNGRYFRSEARRKSFEGGRGRDFSKSFRPENCSRNGKLIINTRALRIRERESEYDCFALCFPFPVQERCRYYLAKSPIHNA